MLNIMCNAARFKTLNKNIKDACKLISRKTYFKTIRYNKLFICCGLTNFETLFLPVSKCVQSAMVHQDNLSTKRL